MNVQGRLACFLVLAFAFAPSVARADEAASPAASNPKIGRTLLLAGAGVFSVGYFPMVGAAVPSVGGLAVRFFYVLGTLGLGCWAGGDKSPDDRRPVDEWYRARTPDYLCSGTHGGALLLVPVAGPLLFAKNHPEDHFLNPHGNSIDGGMRTALYVSAGVQVAGLLLVLAGGVVDAGERSRRSIGHPGSTAADTERAHPGPRLRVLPTVTPTSVGVSASLIAF